MIQGLKNRLHYFFVPSEKNNFRAKSLQHDFLTYYLVLAFAFVVAMKSFGGGLNVLGFATDITIDNLNQFTNEERQKNNLSPLVYNSQLSVAAQRKAEDMLAKNYWSHYSPDGRTPWDFILNSGYRYEVAGENLAKNFLFSRNVVDAWMQSPTHRENILRTEYTEVGYAIVNGVLNGEQTTLVVQMFGKPSLRPVAIQPTTIPSPTIQQQAQRPKINIAKPVFASQRAVSGPATRSSVYLITTFLVFLILVVAIDLYAASRMNIIRLHGKSLAHFIFLVTVLFGVMLFITKGAIL